MMNSQLTAKHRWAVVNRNSGKVRTSAPTRELARITKRPTERLFDTQSQEYVR